MTPPYPRSWGWSWCRDLPNERGLSGGTESFTTASQDRPRSVYGGYSRGHFLGGLRDQDRGCQGTRKKSRESRYDEVSGRVQSDDPVDRSSSVIWIGKTTSMIQDE